MNKQIYQRSFGIHLFNLVWFDLKLKNCSCELNTNWSIVDQRKILLQFDQSSEFCLSIHNIEISIL